MILEDNPIEEETDFYAEIEAHAKLNTTTSDFLEQI